MKRAIADVFTRRALTYTLFSVGTAGTVGTTTGKPRQCLRLLVPTSRKRVFRKWGQWGQVDVCGRYGSMRIGFSARGYSLRVPIHSRRGRFNVA